MALDSDNLVGLYVAFGKYFLLIALTAVVVYQRIHSNGTSNQRESKHEVVEAHYLGNRNFGPFLTAGSLFAPFLSGYTVVGVPKKAFQQGWTSMRWTVATVSIVFGAICTGGRIHKIGKIRNHQSPVDFMTDRYHSQVIR
jgi:Na+/proline symporter